MPITNFALDMANSQTTTGTFENAPDEDIINQIMGNNPSAQTKASVSGSGQTPSNLTAPSDSFTPKMTGGPGDPGNVPRDQVAKKARYDGMTPLFYSGDFYAVIQLVPDAGNDGAVETFEDFILTSVSSPRHEKSQAFRNFRKPFFYFSGEDVEAWTFSGRVMAGRSSDGTVALDRFSQFYETKLRGTVAAENGYQAFISWNGWVVSGYVFDFDTPQDAQSPSDAGFSFQMWVTGKRYSNAGGD